MDHPMSEGQKRKVWKIVGDELIPCRVEDLKVGDLHIPEGGERVVLAEPPVRGADCWDVRVWTEQQWLDAKSGKVNLKIDGVDFDISKF